MILQPKKRTFRKVRKGRIKIKVSDNTANLHKKSLRYSLKQGIYGLRVCEGGRLTARQIEASRRVITKSLERKGKVYLRSFPDMPITSKPAGTRMGKGKGAISQYAALLKPGQIIYEILGVSKDIAFKALKSASKKISLPTEVVSRKPSLQPKDL